MTEGGYSVFCYRQKTDINAIVRLFWILTFIGAVKGETPCQRAMTQYSLPGASLCYNSSGTGNRVVLDVFDAQHSSVTNCRCTVTTTHSTKVSFAALNSLQPGRQFCQSSIVVGTSTGSGFSLNCFVSGSLNINPIETMSISFEKPSYNYDANYCIMLSPDNADAILTLSCVGDIPGSPTTTSTTTSTTTTTSPMTTTTTSKKTTTTPRTTPTTTPVTSTTTTTPRTSTTTTARPTSISTSAPSTTVTTTTSMSTTKSTTSTSTTTTRSTTSTPQVSTQPMTTQKQSTTERITQSTTKRPTGPVVTPTTSANKGEALTSEWSYIIPLIGAGLILFIAIILAICYGQRKKRKHMYTQRNSLSAYENKAKSPYSSDFDAGPGMTSKISTSTKSTDINAIVIDDVRDDVSVSTNLSEGTYIRHSVRQPINNEAPMYAVVDKSTNENKPATDAVYSQVDKSASQTNQPTEADVVY